MKLFGLPDSTKVKGMSNNMRFRVSISQNDRTPLDIGQKRWGGSIRERTRISLNGYYIIMTQKNL